jgi:hypothetical protein
LPELQEIGVVWHVWVVVLHEAILQTSPEDEQSTSVWHDCAKAAAGSSARHII